MFADMYPKYRQNFTNSLSFDFIDGESLLDGEYTSVTRFGRTY